MAPLAHNASLQAGGTTFHTRGSPILARLLALLANWRARPAGPEPPRESGDDLARLSLTSLDHDDVNREVRRLALLATSQETHDYGLLRPPSV